MPSWALKLLLPVIIQVVESILKTVDFKEYADMLFDFLKKAIADSDTELDDKILLPIVRALENSFGDPSD